MKFCIIGIGRFGYQLACSLTKNGMDVLAIDKDEERIDLVKDKVTQALVMDVLDEESLRAIGIEEMSTVIIAIGKHFAQSILLTRILKKDLEIERVIVRSTGDIQKEVLELVGADQVILPELEAAIKLADNLSSPFLETARLDPGFAVSAVITPDDLIGKTIADLSQSKKLRCIALKEDEEITFPTPDTIIKEHVILYFAGDNDELKKLID